MSGFVDYYQVLNVDRNATKEEIKKAYRRAAKTHHPDVGGNHEDFILIKEAYDTLSNDELRDGYNQIYDMFFGSKFQEDTSNQYESNHYQYKHYEYKKQPRYEQTKSQKGTKTFYIKFHWKAYLIVMISFFVIITIINVVNVTKDRFSSSSNSAEATSDVSDEVSEESNSQEGINEQNGFDSSGIFEITYNKSIARSVNLHGLKVTQKSIYMTNHASRREVGNQTQYYGKPVIRIGIEIENSRKSNGTVNGQNFTLQLGNEKEKLSYEKEIEYPLVGVPPELITENYTGNIKPSEKREITLLFFPENSIDLNQQTSARLIWSDYDLQADQHSLDSIFFYFQDDMKKNQDSVTSQTEQNPEEELTETKEDSQTVVEPDYSTFNGRWTDSDDFCGNGYFLTLRFTEKNKAIASLGAAMYGTKERNCVNTKPDYGDDAVVTFDKNGVGTYTFISGRDGVTKIQATIKLANNKVILTTKHLNHSDQSFTYFWDNQTSELVYHNK